MPSTKINVYDFESPYGELIIAEYDNQVCLCDWKYRKMRNQIDSRIQQALGCQFEYQKSDLIDHTISQLQEYLNRKRQKFDIPLRLVGTKFQQSVWNALLTIPYGKTKSYAELSGDIGNKKAIRAVASANGANALSILIPCHRIIGQDGSLTGYAGGIQAKKKLLELEGATSQMSLF